jgi:hypothetical protein
LKTAAIRGRSSLRAVSSSTTEASVTTSRSDIPLAWMRGSSGVITSRNRFTMRATRSAAGSGRFVRSYVSGNR